MKPISSRFTKPILLIDFDGTMRPDTGKRFMSVIPSIAEKWGIPRAKFEAIRKETRDMQHYGIWNLVLHLCNHDFAKFNKMCNDVFEQIDYDDVQPNKNLYNQLVSASKKYDLFCSTNNHRIHVDRGCRKMFGKGLNDLCFKTIDITATYKDGHFWTKHTPGAMGVITNIIHADPENCTLIDDCPDNIKNAENSHMKTVHITPDFTLSDYLNCVLCE